MDVVEAIQTRKSIRAFKPDPVPKEILQEVLEIAIRAPSWANTQPWEFAIVGGSKLEELKQALTEKSDQPPRSDLTFPLKFPEPYDTRRRAVGLKVLEIKGIAREDRERRREWHIQGIRFFEAPNGIIIYIDRSFYFLDNSLNVWPVFDCGLVAMNIMLAATQFGLGTCPEVSPVLYPEVVREVLGIPDSKLIIVAIAIGYPDWNDPINQFRSLREPLEKIARWCGFG